ncbi:MAG: hypothetical protein K2X39_05340, partial [Silvanigrellaceae bacterium]|nr:hypothetical protein [Silvanigrellaceae bacterium]
MNREKKFGFMKSLFNGNINEIALHHYPFFNTNRENDFNVMHQAINDFLKDNVDSKKFDEDKKLPPEFIKSLKEMGL